MKNFEDITIKHKKQTSLKNSIKEGSFHSIMTGFGENYVSPFAIALNATNPQIAFLTSIPLLLASLFQLVAAKFIDTYKKRKKIMLVVALIQSLIWFPLFLIPFLTKNVIFLIAFFSIYWVAGFFGVPAWNSWMGDLVEENQRGRYFGLRNKVIGFFAFASLFGAGFLLNAFTNINPFIGFGVIFSIALIAKLFSFHNLRKIYEPRYIVERRDYFTFFDFVRKMRYTNYGKYTIFKFFFRFSVSISAPFFAVYMLRVLGFSYAQYTILIGIAAATSFLTMTYWGRYSDRFGNKKIMTVTALLVPFIPIMWIFSSSIVYLFFLQLVAGFIWAGFNLSSANFIFDAVPAPKRARCNAYYNVFNGVAIFIGASLGGFFANYIIAPKFFISNLLVVFLISGILRLVFVLMFLPRFREERKVEKIKDSKLLFNVVAIDPVKGLMYESITGMRVIRHVGGFGFKGLKTGVETIKKLTLDLDKTIKKRKELKERMKFVPKKEKEFEARELDYMIKELDKKIKRIKEIRDDYIREPE